MVTLAESLTITTMKNESGVYCVLIPDSQKIYVGSSIHVRDRLSTHKSNLKRGKHDNKHLQRSYNKHGNAFFFILEYCNNLQSREQFWIDLLQPEFNMRIVSESNAGMRWGRKDRRKFSTKEDFRAWQKDFLDSLKEKRKQSLGREVVRMSGNIIELYDSIKDAAKAKNVSRETIINWIRGASLENHSEDIVWCFKEDSFDFFS